MEDKKYTISFINGQPGLVVKGDDSVEVANAIAKILPIYSRFRDAINEGTKATNSAPNAPENGAVCEEHGVKMASGISRKTNNPYWYHDSPEGVRCFGKGYVKK